MDYSNIPLFAVMKSKLNYMSERQSVLARNIANADTPGYRAQDLAEPDFGKIMSQKLRMAAPHSGHMTGTGGGTGAAKVIERKTTDELNPNGNNVVIEEEMSKVAMNQAEYQKVLNLYSKTISMFKLAIGRPTGG